MLGAVVIATALTRSVSFLQYNILEQFLSAFLKPHSLGTFLAEQESTASGRERQELAAVQTVTA